MPFSAFPGFGFNFIPPRDFQNNIFFKKNEEVLGRIKFVVTFAPAFEENDFQSDVLNSNLVDKR